MKAASCDDDSETRKAVLEGVIRRQDVGNEVEKGLGVEGGKMESVVDLLLCHCNKNLYVLPSVGVKGYIIMKTRPRWWSSSMRFVFTYYCLTNVATSFFSRTDLRFGFSDNNLTCLHSRKWRGNRCCLHCWKFERREMECYSQAATSKNSLARTAPDR